LKLFFVFLFLRHKAKNNRYVKDFNEFNMVVSYDINNHAINSAVKKEKTNRVIFVH